MRLVEPAGPAASPLPKVMGVERPKMADLLPDCERCLSDLRGSSPVETRFGHRFHHRADVKSGNRRGERLPDGIDVLGTIEKVSIGFTGAPSPGSGAGYRLSRWLLADVAGEHRSAASLTDLERVRDPGLPPGHGTGGAGLRTGARCAAAGRS